MKRTEKRREREILAAVKLADSQHGKLMLAIRKENTPEIKHMAILMGLSLVSALARLEEAVS